MSCFPPDSTTRNYAGSVDPHIQMGSRRDCQGETGMGQWGYYGIRNTCGLYQWVSRYAAANGSLLIYRWDVEILRKALVDPVCSTREDITFQECPVFQPFINNGACRPQRGVLSESFAHNDLVPITRLPGCNPLWTSGPKPGCSPYPSDPDVAPYRATDGLKTAYNSTIPPLSTLPGWKEISCIKSADNMLSNLVRSYDNNVSQSTCLDSCLRSGFSYASIGRLWGNTWVGHQF